MTYWKITQEKFDQEIKEITAFGNPHLKAIREKVDKTINEYLGLLKWTTFKVYLSNWYRSFHGDSNPTDYTKYGGRNWFFTRYIGLEYENHDDKKYDLLNEDKPMTFGLYFNLNIYIPDFTGSNLDVPNKNKIRYEMSGWSLLLRYPLTHDRFNVCERLEYSNSLHLDAEYFRITPDAKAYILSKFEEYTRFYNHLMDIKHYEEGKLTHDK